MNASFNPDSSRQTSVPQGTAQGSRQTPSVPISVYRELATELKATQAMVDSLTQQNQQLSQQNQVLRQEMLSFAESADRLRQAVERSQPQPTATAAVPPQFLNYGQGSGANPSGFVVGPEDEPMAAADSRSGNFGDSVSSGVSHLAGHLTRLVNPKSKAPAPGAPHGRPAPQKKPAPAPGPQMLYTEERLEPARISNQGGGGSGDLSGLWLATTILLIVVSAFGAGFLIMKPLLSNSR